MYLIPIAWLYVTVMMAIAEATSSNGSILGGIVTLVLYGVLPVALVVYLMGAPKRRKAIRAHEAASSVAKSTDPDASSHSTAATEGDAVASVREKE